MPSAAARHYFLFLVLAVALTLSTTAATDVNLVILRYRPKDKKQILNPVRLEISGSKLKSEKSESILSALRKNGEVELLFQTTQTLADEKPKHIEKSDTAAVVLPGDPTAFPPITRLGINFDIHYTNSNLAWSGTVKWSPQLIGRYVVRAKTNANITIIRPFAPAGQTTGFEYPVLKETRFQSSKITKDGELIISSTAAEAGATAPELLLLCIWKFDDGH